MSWPPVPSTPVTPAQPWAHAGAGAVCTQRRAAVQSMCVLSHRHCAVQRAYALADHEGILNSSCRALSEHSGNTAGTIVMSS